MAEMIDVDKTAEMVIEAIEHCKICKCDGCPFKGCPSCCMAVLGYLIKAKERMKKQDD